MMEEEYVLKGWLARGNWTDVGSPHSLRQAEHWKLQDISFTDIIGNLSMHGAQSRGRSNWAIRLPLARIPRLSVRLPLVRVQLSVIMS